MLNNSHVNLDVFLLFRLWGTRYLYLPYTRDDCGSRAANGQRSQSIPTSTGILWSWSELLSELSIDHDDCDHNWRKSPRLTMCFAQYPNRWCSKTVILVA